MPENTVSTARPSKWGNPYRVGTVYVTFREKEYRVHDQRHAVELYKEHLDRNPNLVTEIRDELKGFNLACWCKPGTPCHADVLLKLANERPAPPPLEARCPDCSICGKETDYYDESFRCESCGACWPADNSAYTDEGDWEDPDAEQCDERVQPWLNKEWVTDPEQKRRVVRCLLDEGHVAHGEKHRNPDMTAMWTDGWD
jgi:hypothetical protein